jgi:hypothetical protein
MAAAEVGGITTALFDVNRLYRQQNEPFGEASWRPMAEHLAETSADIGYGKHGTGRCIIRSGWSSIIAQSNPGD